MTLSLEKTTLPYVSPLRPEELRGWWADERMGALVTRLLPHFEGRLGRQDLYEAVQAGTLVAWVIWTESLIAMAFIEVVQYPKGKVCRFAGLAGDDMDEWLDTLVDSVESWARQQGCTHMEIAGRKGWERKMPGYKLRHVILKRKL